MIDAVTYSDGPLWADTSKPPQCIFKYKKQSTKTEGVKYRNTYLICFSLYF